MGFLTEGIWHGSDQDQIGAKGWEPRHEKFNGYVRANPSEGNGEYPAEKGRYHLIVCPGCPLSHRTLIVHQMKRLDEVVTVACVRPVIGPNGREFGTAREVVADDTTGASYLYQVYLGTNPTYSGRDSTPVLWDRITRKMVSNTYRDIFSILNREFDAFTNEALDLQPVDRMADIDAELARLSSGILGIVYQCGFSRSQADYERYAAILGETIPQLASDLQNRPFLLGDRITEPDIALFVCLLRYDAIYLPLFRCTSERIEDYPALTSYIDRIMNIPGVSETFELNMTMTHYYVSHAHLNPTKIVPLPPKLSWWRT